MNTDRFVYVVTDEEFCKIGVANDPEARLRQIQTGNPKKLSLAFYINAGGSALEIERDTHNRLRKHSTSGEWFKVSPSRAIEELCNQSWEYTDTPLLLIEYMSANGVELHPENGLIHFLADSGQMDKKRFSRWYIDTLQIWKQQLIDALEHISEIESLQGA